MVSCSKLGGRLLDSNNIDLPVRNSGGLSYSEALSRFVSDIEWRFIFCLFDTQDFNPNLSWISKKTGCSVEKVNEVVEGLVTLGVVRRTAEGFALVKSDLDLSELGPITRESRIEANVRLTQQTANQRDLVRVGLDRNVVLATNKENIVEFYERMTQLVTEFRQKSTESSKRDIVFALGVIGSSLLKEDQ